MWSRTELMTIGKMKFKANYWKCVLVAFAFAGITSASIGGIISSVRSVKAYQNTGVLAAITDSTATFILFSIFLAVLVISLAIKNLFLGPLHVGCYHFYSENTKTADNFDSLVNAYSKKEYWRSVKTMFLKELFQCAWTLLLIVPGIMKYYEYRMVPYLLADEPEASNKELFEKSKSMMNGNKMNAFLLDLSFLGLDILSICSLGIFGVFYAIPYKECTRAELYQALKPTPQKTKRKKRR